MLISTFCMISGSKTRVAQTDKDVAGVANKTPSSVAEYRKIVNFFLTAFDERYWQSCCCLCVCDKKSKTFHHYTAEMSSLSLFRRRRGICVCSLHTCRQANLARIIIRGESHLAIISEREHGWESFWANLVDSACQCRCESWRGEMRLVPWPMLLICLLLALAVDATRGYSVEVIPAVLVHEEHLDQNGGNRHRELRMVIKEPARQNLLAPSGNQSSSWMFLTFH